MSNTTFLSPVDGQDSDVKTPESPQASPVLSATFVPTETIQKLISSGRQQLTRRPPALPVTGVFIASLLTSLLLWASFFPLNFSPLGWISLAPVLCLVRLERMDLRQYAVVYVGCVLSQITQLQWMRLGDPTMYIAWLALGAYLGLYFPMYLAACRTAVKTLSIPLCLAAPLLWIGVEFLKAHLLTGFAWYFLGHTQYRWLEIIQISDLVGAYGVSFLLAMSAAVLAELIPSNLLQRIRLDVPNSSQPLKLGPTVLVGICFVTVLGYGYLRRSQAHFTPGPRIALIQGNFPAALQINPDEFADQHRMHERLTGLAVREQPDIVVWPEGMFRWPLLKVAEGMKDDDLERVTPSIPAARWRDTTVRDVLVRDSQKSGAALIMGLNVVEANSQGIKSYNSAAFIRPDLGFTARYDKIHLVPFGEYLPLRDVFPWIQKFTPYPPEFGLARGGQAEVFEYHGHRIMPVICFEDTVPHLVREMSRSHHSTPEHNSRERRSGKAIDVIVNLSNDGWFHGSAGLDQHLITAAFRAVECRTPLVRAVNTGVSAFVDGDGAIREPEAFIDGDNKGRKSMTDSSNGRWHRQLNAALVSTVPLDNRESFYVRFGDWFAGLGCAAFVFCTLMSFSIPVIQWYRP